MNYQYENKIAIVTGGSSGIGLALSKQLAAAGAHVWLVARHPEPLDAAIESIRASRKDQCQCCGVISADLTDFAQAENVVRQVQAEAGPVDVLINCASAAHPGYVQDLSIDIFHWMMDVNYFGTVHAVKAVLPGMMERRSGLIINFCSIAGIVGVFGYTAYGPSKFAVRGFSDTLRSELKPHGIRVAIVYPVDTDTPQLAYENQFKPQETKDIAAASTTMTPEQVASATLRGAAGGRYVILPGLEPKLWYHLIQLGGNLAYPVLDLIIANSQKKMKKAKKNLA
jgi:3-dehydrosphinganine reductase